jgi:hypothetical protein
MKRGFLFLFIILLGGFRARAELGLALAPMRVEIKMSAGGQYTDSLRLSNDSDEPSRVRAEMLDWYLDDTMTPQFSEHYAQEKGYSCRDWLQINPREMDLVAKGAFRVRYTLRVPAETPAGEYHCGAGFVTMPPVNPEVPPMGMHIAVRAVAAIYVIVGNPTSEPAMKDLSLRNTEDGWEAVALFENQGLRHYRIQGFVEVQDANGKLVARVDYPQVPVLAKRAQLFPIQLKTALKPGVYVLHSQADVGLPETLEASTRVVVEDPSRKKK